MSARRPLKPQPLSSKALLRAAEISLEAAQSSMTQLGAEIQRLPGFQRETNQHMATMRVTLNTLAERINRRKAAAVVITNLVTNAAIALSVAVVSVSFTNWHPSGTEMHVKTVTSREHRATYRVAGKPETLTRLEPVSTNVARFQAKVVWTEVPLKSPRSPMGVPDLPPLPAGLVNTNKP